jgi:hypothetical protein
MYGHTSVLDHACSAPAFSTRPGLTFVLCCGCVALQVAVIKEAGTAAQATWFSSLARVEQDTQPGVPLSPCIIVVGQVAGLPGAWAGAQPS